MSNSNGKQRDLRFSLSDLEQLTTHQMAELLSNIVLLLRRLPDVPCSTLGQPPATEQQQPAERIDFVTKARDRVNSRGLPEWTGEE